MKYYSKNCHKTGFGYHGFVKKIRFSFITDPTLHCVSKSDTTLKCYSSKLYGLILMMFGGNIPKKD